MRGTKPNIRIPKESLKTAPKPPAWLSKDAKVEWRRVVPILVERGILTKADLGSVECYCTAIGTVRECQRQINKDGPMIKTSSGMKRHTLFGVQNSAITTARQNAAELGLTPVSRSRPSIREDFEDDGDLSPLDL